MINEIGWYSFRASVLIAELIILYIFLELHLEKKDKSPYKHYVLILLSALGIAYMGMNNDLIFIKCLLSYVLVEMVAVLFFKGRLIEKIVFATMYLIYLCIIDIVAYDIIALANRSSLDEGIMRSTLCIVATMVLSKIILIGCVLVEGYAYKNITEEMPIKFWYMMMATFMISLIIIVGIAQLNINDENRTQDVLFILISVGISITNILIYVMFIGINHYVKNEKDHEIIEYQNELLVQAALESKEYNKEVRKMWHDFNNHISCIDMLLQMKNIEKARKYIGEMSVNSERTYMGIKTENEIVDAVMNQKYKVAKAHEITFVVEGTLEEDLNMTQVDLCALLSNGLDNAIEANLKIEDVKRRKINVRLKRSEDQLSIDITNAIVVPLQENKELKTTKTDKKRHGIGMQSMQKVIEKYNGSLVWYCKSDNFYLEVMVRV